MSHLVNMATCYRETSQYDQAEECYCIVIKKDGSNLTARKELIKMFDDANMPERAASYIKDLAFRRGKKFRPIEGVLGRPRRHSRVVNDDSILSTELGDSDIQTLLQTPLSAKPKPRKRHYWHEDQEDLGPVFDRLRNLRDSYRSGDISARTEWIEIVQPLIPRFRQTRPLYPHERSTKFFGYSKEAKAWATRLKTPFTAGEDCERKLHVGISRLISMQTTQPGMNPSPKSFAMSLLLTGWTSFSNTGYSLLRTARRKSRMKCAKQPPFVPFGIIPRRQCS